MSCAASHTKKLDSIQRRALRLVVAANLTPQSELANSPWLTVIPQGRRSASDVSQGTGTGSATPGWVTPASTSRHTEHGNDAR